MEEIEHNENYFETLSFVKAALVCKTSFEEGHPIAHRWVLFHKALDLFPKSKEIRILYARYAVIYPDEVGELEIACQELAKHKKHSIVIKHCLFQIHSILQQREVALSVSIKKSLSKLSKKVDKCRGQNRYIWECIIRGNLEELETLGARLKLLQENIERDYEQLRLIYPNNSYIAQGYFAYLKEFVRDQTRVAEMGYVYQRLRQGSRIMIEKRYVFASKYFPNIPNEEQHITLKNLLQKKESKHKLLEEKTHESSVKSSTSSSALGSSDSSNSNEITSSFMNESEEFLQYRYIESMVNSVQIPSMKYGPLIIALFIIIICGCIIGIFVFIFSEIGNITEVITIINKISELTFTISELPIFTYHAIYFNTNKTTMISLKDRWDIIYGTNKQIPDYWSTDTNAALQKVKEISSLLSDINTRIQSFSTNEHFQDAIDLLYSNILEMNIYTSHEDYTIENYSLQYMITYLMNIAITAVNTETPETILDDFEFWTMIKNIKNLIGYCESFEIKSINGIFDELESAKQQIYIFTLCLILLIYVAFISYIIYLIISLNSEKNMIYESFKSLPKSVISTIVNKLNKKKQNKEEDDNDINGSNSKVQSDLEDNAYRILSTSVNNESGFTGKFWRVLILIIIFSLCIICIVLLFLLQTSSAIERFKQIIPLYAEIPRTGLTFNQMLFNALRLSSESEFNGDESEWKLPKNAKENYQYITEDLRLILDNAVEIVNYLRLGSTDFQSQGLQIGGYDMISILTENPCVRDTYLITQDYQVFECTSYENVISYIWFQFIEEFALNEYNINSLSFADDKLNFMIVWLLGCSKDEYIIPIFEVLQVVSDSYSGSWTIVNMVIPIIVLTLIVIICCSILIPRFMSTANVACWILRLLLFCDPNVVLQSKPIMRIIMNNFTKNKDVNNLQETSNFYETVVSNLLDGVIFLTNTFDIISCNRSIENVIGKEPQSLIGKNINEIFTDPYGKDSSLSAFYLAISGISKSQRTPSLVIQIEVMNKQKEVTLELSLTAVSSNGYVLNKTTNIDSIAFFALLIKDMTMTIAQNKLLLEESIKSEKLLSMILPPLIVTKLQNGEKNISFSVKSASIMFVDIVSFTPWCGSHPAAYVMKTLNRLFLEFDRILKKYERMMKIKCIGDCYMCAGGIFDEINQPAEHTKQTISFGIDIIKAIQLLDIELNESLRIRVGVNTGGPIVAGVLGIEKPTFDILGSAICLAAMMEHHGVPMNVHIPQHCYDLVFGTIFRIKERGDVEVKGKMYHTYVVTGYE